MVRAIIGLGHNPNLKLVAEGVETQEQLMFLRHEGCDLVQGYPMSKAIPADAFMALLSTPGTVAQSGSQLLSLLADRSSGA